MDFTLYSEKFTAKALSSGYSAEIIHRCLSYAEPIFAIGLPVIYNNNHLSSLVGYNSNYLLRAVTYTDYFYRKFTVQKKNRKGERKISEPLPSLKEIQHWILTEILYQYPVSKYAKAFIPGATIKQNVVFHRDTKVVLALDIEDFFSSIKITDVRKIFRSMGYTLALSNILSKLCCHNEQLPQGAPTSPYLSNIHLYTFDEKIGKLCFERKIRYTRYADDITFSGEFDPLEIETIVKNVLDESFGSSLKLNDDKRSIMKDSDRQIITGIVVNEKLQVKRSTRKNIRQEMHYIRKFGVGSHLHHTKTLRSRYLDHLLGKINFILFINNDDKEFLEYRDFIRQLKKNAG